MSTIDALAVFCGSRPGLADAYARVARDLGHAMAGRGIRLVYGGGGIGLMGAVANAVLDRGGEVTGIIPRFLQEQELRHPDLTELVVVDSMHERKRRMFERADGFVVLPGGLGTLDETFEIVTWKQLGQHDKPIVVVDVDGYWSVLGAVFDRIVEHGFASESTRDLVTTARDVDGIFTQLARAPEPAAASDTDRL